MVINASFLGQGERKDLFLKLESKNPLQELSTKEYEAN